jgi:membrane protein DedA with SNARE-associated domain
MFVTKQEGDIFWVVLSILCAAAFVIEIAMTPDSLTRIATCAILLAVIAMAVFRYIRSRGHRRRYDQR